MITEQLSIDRDPVFDTLAALADQPAPGLTNTQEISIVPDAAATAAPVHAQEIPIVSKAAGAVGAAVEDAPLADVLRIDQGQLHKHLDQIVRDSVEQTLNALLDAEADQLCGAKR
jgi:hypothetical protein